MPSIFIYGCKVLHWQEVENEIMTIDNFKKWNNKTYNEFNGLQFLLNFFFYFLGFTTFIFFLTCIIIKYYSLENWKNHPIAQNLTLYTSTVEISEINNESHENINKETNNLENFSIKKDSWVRVAESVSKEFQLIDKFSSNFGNSKFYLTNSWMIKVGIFNVNIVQKNDVELNLAVAKDHTLSHISDFGAQILEIKVNPIHKTNIQPFNIRLSSFDYNSLKESLKRPIIITENIVIKQSLSDRFVETFIDVINGNPKYTLPPIITLENCLGCLIKPSQVKLYKNCIDTSPETPNDAENSERTHCKMCYCRPMWCISCMAKWFASRQNQKTPENWLSGYSPCPLCRSTFCILDVCLLR
ncbi:unnamed protein product [Gordionus sp. m RMFG-2023]